MKKIINKAIDWLKGQTTKEVVIEGPLTWTVDDFEKAKRWAKSKPHPMNPKLTFWDYIYSKSRYDSAELLCEINKVLTDEQN